MMLLLMMWWFMHNRSCVFAIEIPTSQQCIYLHMYVQTKKRIQKIFIICKLGACLWYYHIKIQDGFHLKLKTIFEWFYTMFMQYVLPKTVSWSEYLSTNGAGVHNPLVFWFNMFLQNIPTVCFIWTIFFSTSKKCFCVFEHDMSHKIPFPLRYIWALFTWIYNSLMDTLKMDLHFVLCFCWIVTLFAE